jgi:hypothetical protein
MRSAFRCRRRASGAGARAREAGQASRRRQAAETGQSHPMGGARRPLRALAVSGGQRRAVPRSFSVPCPAPSGQPSQFADGRCAGRAVAGRPLRCRRGTVRPAWSVVRPLAARRAGSGRLPAGAVAGPGSRRRAGQSGRAVAARSGTGLPADGPRGTVRARRSWSGRAPRGGPRRPGREAGAGATGPAGSRPGLTAPRRLDGGDPPGRPGTARVRELGHRQRVHVRRA